ncbi:MAG: S41 family peptidase [Pirellulaceae bacterium]
MPLRNIVIIAVAMVISLTCFSAVSKNRYANLYAEAMEIVEREALLEFDKRQLFEASMKGMLSDFDRNSSFLTREIYQAIEEDLRQEFGGVGMYVDVDPRTNELIVLAPMPGSPAAKAGLLPGDVIVEIAGKKIDGDKRMDAIQMMRGPKGEDVSIRIVRDGEERKVTITRDVIPVESVHGDWRDPDGTWHFELQEHPRIGYFRILEFGDKTVDEFLAALDTNAKKIDSLIIDLRNNSGGLLDAAVGVCDALLPAGEVVVETRGRDQKRDVDSRYSTNAPVVPENVKVVVLINRNSASASEIVSACLQDYGRATVIGERSFGKGTVQNVIPLEPNISAIKLTTASYWRPSGKNIDRSSSEQNPEYKDTWGVSPNDGFALEMTEEEIFNDYRRRHLRDLKGIHDASGYVAVVDTMTDNDATSTNEEGDNEPGPDSETSDSKSDQSTLVPDIDRPLAAAVDFLVNGEKASE